MALAERSAAACAARPAVAVAFSTLMPGCCGGLAAADAAVFGVEPGVLAGFATD